MPKELFHYCSNSKCFSILESKTIRLSDIQKSNDYKELCLFFPKIFSVLERLYREKPFSFKCSGKIGIRAFEILLNDSYDYWYDSFSTGDFSNFVLCLSEKSDSLSQWRGYADNGKGCCIGFDKNLLKDYCLSTNNVLRLEKVTYLSETGINEVLLNIAQEILNNMDGLREWIVDNITHNDNNSRTDILLRYNFDELLEEAFISSLKYKSYSFKEENEWRIFFSRPAYKKPEWIVKNDDNELIGPDGFADTVHFLNNKVDFSIIEDDIIPFCPINFKEFNANPVSSIMVGPKSRIRPSDLELFLQSKGYHNTKIKKSKITYN